MRFYFFGFFLCAFLWGGPTCPQKIAVGVDVYSSTGRLVLGLMQQRGIPLLAIQSSPAIPAGYHDHGIDWAGYLGGKPLVQQGSLDDLVAQVRGFGEVIGVVGSIDRSVPLAFGLAKKLGLPSNDPDLSPLWIHKGKQVERLRDREVSVPDTLESEYLSRLKTFAAPYFSKNKWVVVKPPQSAGSHDVFICTNQTEVKAAYESILGKINPTGFKNETVLIQEFILGDEYAVDGYIHQGVVHVSDMWLEAKDGLKYLYDDLIPYEGVRQARMVEFVGEVAKALEMHECNFHAELKWTANGPVHLEIAARPLGGASTRMVEYVTGESQLTIMRDLWLDEESFWNRPPGYQLQRHVRGVYLVSRREGIVKSLHHLDEIAALPSVKKVVPVKKPGERLGFTRDFLSFSVLVELEHESQAQIEVDYEVLKALEDRIYDLEGE